MSPVELYIQCISDAVTRIRMILFVNLGLCAIVLANAYLENFSFDDEILRSAYVFKALFKSDQKKLFDSLEKESDPVKKIALERQLSNVGSRIDRIDNSLKDYKLRSVTVPLTGVNVPANDLNVVCGLFLLFISLWLVFSVHQIRQAFADDVMRRRAAEYMPALKHALMFMLPKEQRVLSFLAILVIAAPAIAMTVATLNDAYSIISYDYKSPLISMLSTVIIRLVFLTAISVALWGISIVALRAWKDLSAALLQERGS